MVSVIVFDLDDTLYLEREYVRSGLQVVDAWIRERYSVPGFFEGAWTLFEAGRRGDLFDRVLPSLGIGTTPGLIRKLIELYRSHMPAINLAPDAVEILLSARQCHDLALLTDGHYEAQQRKVAALKLAERLHPIIYTDSFGRGMWKPHPQGFIAIQEWYGLPATEFAYFADNPRKDFIAPRRLGWRTVRVRRPFGEHFNLLLDERLEADQTVRSLEEVDWARL